ncbi:MAG TPA: thioesterase [Deltaproteobacteria bacterium]|nr:thioesterase [Deltaproteobacteria bacterium]HCP47472.1 thioesterase [Deltaproteobacteria bacterium]|tara:strand:+ start:346 stop:792 length:447 start_codon:yes stop_codon:yes gene_type:complete
MEHYRKLERMYLAAPINQLLGPSLVVRDREATITHPVREDHCHAGQALHGSMYFKCLDDACFFAANSVVEDVFVLTADFHIRLMRPVPVTADHVRAEGRIVSETARILICEGVLYDDQGAEVARGSGSFMRSRVALAHVPGYATLGTS